MARPRPLCYLKKDTLIGANEGFVDTFNWMVDFINNLRGDDSYIELENPTGDNPKIKFIGDIEAGGSFDVKCIDSDGVETTATIDGGTLTFKAGENTNISFKVTDDGVVTVDVKYK